MATFQSQILGYLNHEMSRFTDDGWIKTGDLLEPATQEEGEAFSHCWSQTRNN